MLLFCRNQRENPPVCGSRCLGHPCWVWLMLIRSKFRPFSESCLPWGGSTRLSHNKVQGSQCHHVHLLKSDLRKELVLEAVSTSSTLMILQLRTFCQRQGTGRLFRSEPLRASKIGTTGLPSSQYMACVIEHTVTNVAPQIIKLATGNRLVYWVEM